MGKTPRNAAAEFDRTPKDAEIVIGIVTRIGVNTTEIFKIIQAELSNYGYRTFDVHLTNTLDESFPGFSSGVVQSPIDKRYDTLIEACNNLREATQSDIMALLGVYKITSFRGETDLRPAVVEKKAYVINQIKRTEESDTLRQIYGEYYVQISCHADQHNRISRLTRKIAEAYPETPKNTAWELKARELVNKDESQETIPNGQRVREVFPTSDVIIDANSEASARKHLERFFRALFGDHTVSPSHEEFGMAFANLAGLRSSDLSRQVGAAVFSPTMEVQSLGYNEVPKAFGGTYWEGDVPDGRDFALGKDSNVSRKRAMIIDLVSRLKTVLEMESLPEDLNEMLFNRSDSLIEDSQIMDSLEYGRTVHAEMNAISDAVRLGISLRGSTLYSNTFPCHNCAKHIVASGIKDVVYMHPYPKSYARELFEDSISVDPPTVGQSGERICPPKKVCFRQFVGILGPLYHRVFRKKRWKDNGGKVPEFDKSKANYIRQTVAASYPLVEALFLKELVNHIAEYLSQGEGAPSQGEEMPQG
jgi:deoxycytidylate deaminase